MLVTQTLASLNNASVLWCTKKSRMRVLMEKTLLFKKRVSVNNLLKAFPRSIDMKWRNHVIINRNKPCKEVRYVIVLSTISRGDWLGKPANIKVGKQRCCRLCWKLPDCAQSFVFCSQINAMFLLVNNFKLIRMLLNVAHGQVQKS